MQRSGAKRAWVIQVYSWLFMVIHGYSRLFKVIQGKDLYVTGHEGQRGECHRWGLKGSRCQNRASLCQMMKCRVFLRKREAVRILSRRVTPSVLCIWKIILAAEWSLADAMMGGMEFGDTVQLACNPQLAVIQPRDDCGLNNGDTGGQGGGGLRFH